MPVAEPKPNVSAPTVNGVVVPHKPRWFQRVAAVLIYALISGVAMTLRYRWVDRSGYFDSGAAGKAVYCIWHNRLALCLKAYSGFIQKHNRTQGLAAMVSASKDGALLASVLECFKVQPIRGSTSRRGRQALLELMRWSARGYDVAITPDGPRGPRYVVQEGIVSLAQITGLPIIPVSYNLGWKIRVKSWDQFQIPIPFSRCEMIFEKPIRVPRESGEVERENFRLQLERTLNEISRD